MNRSFRLLGLLFAFALFAVACGDSDDTSDGAAADTTEAAAAETTEAATETTTADTTEETTAADDTAAEGGELSGDPVIMGYIGTTVGTDTFWVSGLAAIDAAEKAINDAGGIDGRPVEVLSCDDGGDPNVTVECMQSLIDDGAVTFVGSFTQFGAALNPEITAAGRVSIGSFLFTGGDFGVPDLYATNGGAFTGGLGQFAACATLGATGFTVAYQDIPAGQQVPELVQGVVAPAWPQLAYVSAEPMATDLADFAPIAAKIISDGADCVMAGGSDLQNASVTQALRSQGYEGYVTSAALAPPTELINNLGDDANGMVLVNMYNQTSEGWATFLDELAAIDPDQPPDDIAANTWLAVHIAADVIAVSGDDPAAIAAAIPEVVVDYDTGGMTDAPLDWSVPGDNPLGMVNLRNLGFTIAQIQDGEVIPGTEFIGLFG